MSTARLRTPTSLATDRDWAWVAGFIEGEGSFNNAAGRVQITARQVDPEPILKLHALCGGAVYRDELVTEARFSSRPSFVWALGGEPAQILSARIYPLLSRRRQRQAAPGMRAKISRQREKTHCPSGHPYDEKNTYVWKNRRVCRACHMRAQINYRARKKAA